MNEQFHLDDQAQLALEVAHHAAVANGDGHCGTEYLLYGLVVTASSDLTELVELFALNALRVDRSIDRLIDRRKDAGTFAESAPILSLRAQHALCTPRLDGRAPTGVFEVLHGLLADDDSGACHVLRDLGVSPAEARRLTAYGIRHLSKDEVDALIADLDRRSSAHCSWWGPEPGTTLRPIFGANGSGQSDGSIIASSESAQAQLRAVGSNADGFGLTLVVRSLRDWVLPPVFEPVESLVPGHGATFTNGPDFFLVQAVAADGMVLDNRHLGERFAHLAPERPRLIRIGHREERRVLNDRRVQNLTVITTDWWAWPLPAAGPIEIRVDWPAESLSGILTFDATMLRPTL
jgi:hypothetical protein